MNFFKTVSFFYQSQFVNPALATLRHTGLQFRKGLNLFPYDLYMPSFVVRVADRSIANGCGALLNAMGYYDPNNMYFLEEIFQRDLYQYLFDVGANIGVYSLLCASRSNNARIYSFEPHPYTFSLLEENVRLNSFEQQITCFQTGLSDHDGKVLFLDKPGNSMNRILDPSESNEKAVNVQVYRGDSISNAEGIVPQILKIDVEGHEIQVLSGFERVLNKIQLIFVESWAIAKVTHLLCDQFNFVGPFKIDYRNRRFVKKNLHYEDWVFVNVNAIEVLNTLVSIDEAQM